MTNLISGVAGFSRMHTGKRLFDDGETVIGVDDLNNYYVPTLKRVRLRQLEPRAGFTLERMDLPDHDALECGVIYVDDIADCVARIMDVLPCADRDANPMNLDSTIGNNRPVTLTTLIDVLEEAIGKRDQESDTDAARRCQGDLHRYRRSPSIVEVAPTTLIESGLGRYVERHRTHYCRAERPSSVLR